MDPPGVEEVGEISEVGLTLGEESASVEESASEEELYDASESIQESAPVEELEHEQPLSSEFLSKIPTEILQEGPPYEPIPLGATDEERNVLIEKMDRRKTIKNKLQKAIQSKQVELPKEYIDNPEDLQYLSLFIPDREEERMDAFSMIKRYIDRRSSFFISLAGNVESLSDIRDKLNLRNRGIPFDFVNKDGMGLLVITNSTLVSTTDQKEISGRYYELALKDYGKEKAAMMVRSVFILRHIVAGNAVLYSAFLSSGDDSFEDVIVLLKCIKKDFRNTRQDYTHFQLHLEATPQRILHLTNFVNQAPTRDDLINIEKAAKKANPNKFRKIHSNFNQLHDMITNPLQTNPTNVIFIGHKNLLSPNVLVRHYNEDLRNDSELKRRLISYKLLQKESRSVSWMKDEDITYWLKHIRQQIRFFYELNERILQRLYVNDLLTIKSREELDDWFDKRRKVIKETRDLLPVLYVASLIDAQTEVLDSFYREKLEKTQKTLDTFSAEKRQLLPQAKLKKAYLEERAKYLSPKTIETIKSNFDIILTQAKTSLENFYTELNNKLEVFAQKYQEIQRLKNQQNKLREEMEQIRESVRETLQENPTPVLDSEIEAMKRRIEEMLGIYETMKNMNNRDDLTEQENVIKDQIEEFGKMIERRRNLSKLIDSEEAMKKLNASYIADKKKIQFLENEIREIRRDDALLTKKINTLRGISESPDTTHLLNTGSKLNERLHKLLQGYEYIIQNLDSSTGKIINDQDIIILERVKGRYEELERETQQWSESYNAFVAQLNKLIEAYNQARITYQNVVSPERSEIPTVPIATPEKAKKSPRFLQNLRSRLFSS